MIAKVEKCRHMRFDIISIFPRIFDSYLSESVLLRAQEKKLITVCAHNLRDFSTDKKHKKVDDRPYGGGAGMVLMAEPVLRSVDSIFGGVSSEKRKRSKIIVLSAKGKQFNQNMAYGLVKKCDRIIFVSGRYEGIDERVVKALRQGTRGKRQGIKMASVEEVSIGSYVLTDGDVAAMVIISAVARLIPGVIQAESLKEESFSAQLKIENLKLEIPKGEYPHYTRPDILQYKGRKYRVPAVLMSGDHKKIAEWRRRRAR